MAEARSYLNVRQGSLMEQASTQKAICLRTKEYVTEDEYIESYKSTSKDYYSPLWFAPEFLVECTSILYLPRGRIYMMCS